MRDFDHKMYLFHVVMDNEEFPIIGFQHFCLFSTFLNKVQTEGKKFFFEITLKYPIQMIFLNLPMYHK